MRKKTGTVALAAEGGVARTSIGRLPGLAEHLGPVTASSGRVASRIVNSLRAGHPAQSLEEFAACPLVLIAVRDSALAGLIRQLLNSEIDWADRVVVLCDSRQGPAACAALAARGAVVASFDIVAGLALMEGDRVAIREFRRILLPRPGRVVRLLPGGGPLVFAGITLAGLSAHVAAAASECIQTAGVNAAQTRRIVHGLMVEALRAHGKAGRKAMGSNWGHQQGLEAERHIAALRSARPDVAEFFEAVVEAAVRFAGGAVRSPEQSFNAGSCR